MTHHITYPSHPLLVTITFVSQDTYGLGLTTYSHFILMTHSGMVMDVTPVVPAAHSTILHISLNTLTTLPLMILNYDCVVITHHMMRIQQLNWLKITEHNVMYDQRFEHCIIILLLNLFSLQFMSEYIK